MKTLKPETRIFLLIAIMVLVFGLISTAHAEGVNTGPDCTLTWGAPTTGGPVAGYRVYVGTQANNKTRRHETTATRASCADLDLTAGQQYAHVTAFNVAGESGGTNTVPFFVVTSPPGIPLNLRVQ